MTSFIQISDLHLFADKTKLLNEVNPFDNLEKTINKIKLIESEHDFLIITGDCSQDCSEESYAHLKDLLKRLEIKYYIFPGNHDDIENMNSVFSFGWKNGEVNYTFSHDGNNFHVIDSTIPPSVDAQFSDSQLEWLDKELGNVPSIVLMHHHPVPVGSTWIDKLTFNDDNRFNELVSKKGNVKAVLFGHIHQEFQENINGILYASSPATVYQVVPKMNDFKVDKTIAGFRKYNFNGKEIKLDTVWVD